MTADAAPGNPAAAERQLVEAVRRAARQPQGRTALVLQLSRLAPPAPRPHHRRIARAMMQDTAQRHEGQLFTLRNGDMVLLCRSGAVPAAEQINGAASPDPASLPRTLARLFSVDAPDPALLVSVWPLDHALELLLNYTNARLAESIAIPPPEEEFSSVTGAVDAIATLVATGRIQDLMQRQTAVALQSVPRDGTEAGVVRDAAAGQVLQPIYREVGFSIPALEARIRAGGQASADPFLFRHLAARLDRRMLEVLRQELGSGSALDLAADYGTDIARSPLHLNLTLAGVLSDSFARLTVACRGAGATLGVEIALMEACADPEGFAAARRTVRDAGMALVLDGVSHLALLLARPAALRPDMVKLDWSPRLPDLAADDELQVRAALEGFGVQRVVLHRAETEAALRWGLAHGIRRFQGRHVDAMLGASRILGCALSAGCTLRQCIERASATGLAGRAGCGNIELLDAGAPQRLRPPQAVRPPTTRRYTAAVP